MVEWRINILGHPSRLLEPRGMMYSIWQNRAWTNSLPLPTDWKGPVQTSRESPSLLWVLWEFVSYVAESRGHYTQSPNPINSTCGMCSFMSNSLKPHRLSPSRLSVHGIFPARIQEWVAISFSRGSSRPRDWTCVSCTGRQILHSWATGETPT